MLLNEVLVSWFLVACPVKWGNMSTGKIGVLGEPEAWKCEQGASLATGSATNAVGYGRFVMVQILARLCPSGGLEIFINVFMEVCVLMSWKAEMTFFVKESYSGFVLQ